MDWLTNLIWHDGKFFGLPAVGWEIIGWLGNGVFFSRVLVQWYATERQKRVAVPLTFWWLSLAGSLLLLLYAVSINKRVVVFSYAFTWIPYIRNLVIHRRHSEAHQTCLACEELCPPHAKFCPACGTKLAADGANVTG